jgi:hypothetical protein
MKTGSAYSKIFVAPVADHFRRKIISITSDVTADVLASDLPKPK